LRGRIIEKLLDRFAAFAGLALDQADELRGAAFELL
jgi:hypothetical protein